MLNQQETVRSQDKKPSDNILKTVDLLGKTPSVTATVSRNQGLTKLEGADVALKHMTKVSESMSQAASLASLGKEFSESFIKASNLAAVGNFHIHLEPTWLFFIQFKPGLELPYRLII